MVNDDKRNVRTICAYSHIGVDRNVGDRLPEDMYISFERLLIKTKSNKIASLDGVYC